MGPGPIVPGSGPHWPCPYGPGPKQSESTPAGPQQPGGSVTADSAARGVRPATADRPGGCVIAAAPTARTTDMTTAMVVARSLCRTHPPIALPLFWFVVAHHDRRCAEPGQRCRAIGPNAQSHKSPFAPLDQPPAVEIAPRVTQTCCSTRHYLAASLPAKRARMAISPLPDRLSDTSAHSTRHRVSVPVIGRPGISCPDHRTGP